MKSRSTTVIDAMKKTKSRSYARSFCSKTTSRTSKQRSNGVSRRRKSRCADDSRISHDRFMMNRPATRIPTTRRERAESKRRSSWHPSQPTQVRPIEILRSARERIRCHRRHRAERTILPSSNKSRISTNGFVDTFTPSSSSLILSFRNESQPSSDIGTRWRAYFGYQTAVETQTSGQRGTSFGCFIQRTIDELFVGVP